MNPPTGAPPWRRLAALTALVVLAHVLLLQAIPARPDAQLEPDRAHAPTFATRSIEARPPPDAVVVRSAPPARPAPKARVAASRKTQENPAPAPVNNAQTAINSAAIEAAQNAAEGSATNVAGSATQAELTAAPNPEIPANPANPVKPANPAASADAGTPTLPAGFAGPQTTPVTAINLPASVRLLYKMTGTSKGLNYSANAELAWNNAGTQYDAYMKVSALFLGSRSMTSAGLITPVGLAPTRFSDKFRSEQAAHFVAEQGKITFSANTPDAPWVEGAQDRVSVFIQLGGMLAGKPGDFPAGSSITLYTAGPREADSWTFTVEAEEQLKLPGGEMLALKLTRKPRREYDQKVEIWYAPALGYLPVRNRITQQNGDFIDQQLAEVVKP